MRSHSLYLLLILSLLNVGNAHAAEDAAAAIFNAIKANDMARLNAIVDSDPSVLVSRSDKGLSPLMFAAYQERPEMVVVLHDKTSHLDFYEACVSGDKELVKRFIARGQDVDQRSADGFTPLGLSVFFRQPDIARLLIEAGADVNAKASNTLQVAPIHAAVARSDLASLQFLLSNGANPDQVQQRLMRPLHEAAAAGNLPIVAMLLMFGSDPAARNEEGKTAADFAREKGHTEIAQRLDALVKVNGRLSH